MADIQIMATRIDAMMLPANFSRAYQMYVIQQSTDMQKIAGQANSASSTAESAEEANTLQDEQIAAQGETLSGIAKDYLSKSATSMQSLAGPLEATSFYVNGVKVLGARVMGFSNSVGTAYRGEFDADTEFSNDTLAAGLKEARQRIKALEDAIRNHGLIG